MRHLPRKIQGADQLTLENKEHFEMKKYVLFLTDDVVHPDGGSGPSLGGEDGKDESEASHVVPRESQLGVARI